MVSSPTASAVLCGRRRAVARSQLPRSSEKSLIAFSDGDVVAIVMMRPLPGKTIGPRLHCVKCKYAMICCKNCTTPAHGHPSDPAVSACRPARQPGCGGGRTEYEPFG